MYVNMYIYIDRYTYIYIGALAHPKPSTIRREGRARIAAFLAARCLQSDIEPVHGRPLGGVSQGRSWSH